MAEHKCRITEPTGYDSYARVNCQQKSGGKCIDVVFGIKGSGANKKSEIQALRYSEDVWSVAQAKKHCSSRGGKFDEGHEEEKASIPVLTMDELERKVKGDPKEPHGAPVAREHETVLPRSGYPEVEQVELPDRLKPRHQRNPKAELEERLRQP